MNIDWSNQEYVEFTFVITGEFSSHVKNGSEFEVQIKDGTHVKGEILRHRICKNNLCTGDGNEHVFLLVKNELMGDKNGREKAKV